MRNWNKSRFLKRKQTFATLEWLFWREVQDREEMEKKESCLPAPQIVWSVPEAATTALCTSDDGRDGSPKHVEQFSSK